MSLDIVLFISTHVCWCTFDLWHFYACADLWGGGVEGSGPPSPIKLKFIKFTCKIIENMLPTPTHPLGKHNHPSDPPPHPPPPLKKILNPRICHECASEVDATSCMQCLQSILYEITKF